MVRSGQTLRGRLAYNLTEGPTPNPRWLVTFDEQNHKDEELYEKAFGKTLYSVEAEEELKQQDFSTALSSSDHQDMDEAEKDKTQDTEEQTHAVNKNEDLGSNDAVSASNGRKTSSPTVGASNSLEEDMTGNDNNNNSTAATNDNNGSTVGNSSQSVDSRGKRSVKGKKTVSFSEDGTAGPSDDSSSQLDSNSKRVSAREQRSRRRQAKIEEEAVTIAPMPAHSHKPTASIGGSRSKRRMPGKHSTLKKRKTINSSGASEEVVKVKLNTGTLYLYRGVNRRAEFIRRV